MNDFEAIYKEHFLSVYKYVFSLCRDETLAEEITQEAFYKALNSLNKFNGECKLYVWLCQIAKNTYFSYLKKNKKRVAFNEASLNESDLATEINFEDKETAEKLHTLLHNLDEPYKEVFSLRVFGELPFSKIGELFGKTDSWARLIFYRAKCELRSGLDEDNL